MISPPTSSPPDLTYDELTAAVAAHLRRDALLHPEYGLFNAGDSYAPKAINNSPDLSPAQKIVLLPLG